MAVKAMASITITFIIDVASTCRYYKLQSSTLSPPEKPTTNPPVGWTSIEPSYSGGEGTSGFDVVQNIYGDECTHEITETTCVTSTLYFTDLTVFTDGTFFYSDVSKSTSYEAAKSAYNKAVNSEKTATNYMEFQNGTGLVIGNLTEQTLGKNVLIDSNGMQIRNGSEAMAVFGGEIIELGLTDTPGAAINMLDQALVIESRNYGNNDTQTVIDSSGVLSLESESELNILYSESDSSSGEENISLIHMKSAVPESSTLGSSTLSLAAQKSVTSGNATTTNSATINLSSEEPGESLSWIRLTSDIIQLYGDNYLVDNPEKFREAISVLTPKQVSTGYDVNTMTTDGRYYCGANVSNKPGYVNHWNGWLDVMRYDSQHIYQRFKSYKGDVYERNMVSGTWQPWYGTERFGLAGNTTGVNVTLSRKGMYKLIIQSLVTSGYSYSGLAEYLISVAPNGTATSITAASNGTQRSTLTYTQGSSSSDARVNIKCSESSYTCCVVLERFY